MRTLNYVVLLAIGLGTSGRAWAAPPPAVELEPDAIADAAPNDEAADEPTATEEPDHELAGSEDADTDEEQPAPEPAAGTSGDPKATEATTLDAPIADTVDADGAAEIEEGAAIEEPPAADVGAEHAKTCVVDPVTVRRFGSKSEVTLRLTDCAGRPNLQALPQLSELAQPIAPTTGAAALAAGDSAAPSMQLNPELLVRMQCVVDRFATRTIEIVSGYRPRARAGSRHHSGDALDVRLDGVDNLELSEFARTLEETGVGYYPNSTFVHIDVRAGTAYWVDRSRPGERAKYVRSEGVAVAAMPSKTATVPSKALADDALDDEAAPQKPDAMRAAKAAPVEDRIRETRMVDVPSKTAHEKISGDDVAPIRETRAQSDAPPLDPALQAVMDRAQQVMERELGREGPLATTTMTATKRDAHHR